MTQTTENISRSPTMAELLRVAIEYHLRDLWTALPGKIDKFDSSKQMADVKPLVQDLIATEDGEEFTEEIPIIPNVPVIFPRAGGFCMTMPVKKDDFCLIVFCSRSIDKYLEGDGQDQDPGDFRTHDLTDAVVLMGFSPFSKAIAGFDDEAAVFGVEGKTHVRVKEDLIELGAKGSGEKLSVDSKVQGELKAVRDSLEALVNTFNSHNHITTATVAVGPPGVIAPPASPATPPGPVGPTESELVTIEK